MRAARVRTSRWRRGSERSSGAVSVALLIIGSLLVPLALTGVWVQTVLLDTDRYVQAVTPLIGRASVQQAVAGELADRLLAEFDLQRRIAEVRPEATSQEVDSLTEQVGYYTRLLSLQFVQSEDFVPVWSEANREAHASVVNVIDGEGPVRLSAEGALLVDLGAAGEELTQRLHDANLPLPEGLLPDFPRGDVPVVDVDALRVLRPALSLLARLYIVLPILAVLCLGASVLWSDKRMRAVALVGAGMVITMLALQIGLWVGESRYAEAAARARVPEEISQAMWEPLVGSLDVAARVILIAGVGMLIVAGVGALARQRA